MNSVRLEDLCEAIVDCPHSTPHWTSEGIPVLRNFNLENTVISLDNPSYVDEKDYLDRIKRAEPCEGDLILSREAPMGKVGLMPAGLRCCLGQRLVLLRPNRRLIDPRYLLIAMTSEYVQIQIRRADAAGSIVSNLSLPQIRDLRIPLVEDADDVASVLGAIDDKIALNKKLCAELEETAQLIYDYWFTQFDFPDESGRPYRSSGGKMIYNDSLKRCIPEGWRVERLGVLCDTRLGGTPDTSVAEYWGEGEPWLSSAEVANTPIVRAGKSVTDLGIQNSATSFAPSGSVLLSITRYIRPSLLAIDACFNQSVVAITETDELKAGFLYPFIKGCVPRYLVLRTGAQQPHINKETVDDTMLCVPPKEKLDIYYSRVAPLYAKVIHAAREIDRLESLRGWLLPILMNGQVEIGANGRDRDGVMSEDDAR